jgi:hypothetical protein
MTPRLTARELRAVLLYGAAGVVFYQIGLLLLFFVIPLFLLYLRHDARIGSAGTLVSFLGIAVVSYVRAAVLLKAAVPLDALALGMSMPALMLIGGAITASPLPQAVPRYLKLLAGSIVAAAGCLPLLVFMATNAEFETLMRLQLKALSADVAGAELDMLAAIARNVLWSSFGAGIFLTLGASWLIALRMRARADRSVFTRRVLGFRLADICVWPFLLSWAGVLAGFMVKFPPIGYVSWNCAIVLSALFGFQGYAIIRYWIARIFKEERSRVLVGGLLIMVLFIPGLNVLPLVLIPLLGVSEIWIDYRFEERRGDS